MIGQISRPCGNYTTVCPERRGKHAMGVPEVAETAPDIQVQLRRVLWEWYNREIPLGKDGAG
jgi:hypothetical protein